MLSTSWSTWESLTEKGTRKVGALESRAGVDLGAFGCSALVIKYSLNPEPPISD